MKPEDVSIQNYDYHLPEENIALHPLHERDAARMLVYDNGHISEDVFANVSSHLPPGCLLVFNDTKVINARLSFYKTSGARIEIFCLEPYRAMKEYATVMSATARVEWKCFVGGAAKWKDELLSKEVVLQGEKIILQARKIKKEGEAYIIELSWNPPQYSFAEMLHAAGNVPLPPYIKRTVEAEDRSRYQTIFATHEGSVAAPTAALHFTDNIFAELKTKEIITAFVTLHVGAGTFKPVKADTMRGHEMHAEYIDVDRNAIEKLLENETVVAVGTTSLRTLESLYWLGVKAFLDPAIKHLDIRQWDVYSEQLAHSALNKQDALQALLHLMERNKMKTIFTKTQLLIVPGYKFKMVQMLVTNFHQPHSTLLLLVAAAIGNDWKKMYEYALKNDFRFLSYGDGNLLKIKV